MTTRMDLFATVHKGLRAQLYATSARMGRTDFSDAAESAAAVDAARRLVGLLTEHSEHEDAVLMKVFAELSPELHADLRTDHARVDGLHKEILGIADRLAEAAGAERVALGRRLHERLVTLVAEHLQHMQREEVDGNRVLWAHHDDDGLRAIHGRVMARMAPPRSLEWLGVIFPAVNRPERAMVLQALRAAVPPDALPHAIAPLRASISAAEWADAAAAAGIPPA